MLYSLSKWKRLLKEHLCVAGELADITCVINPERFMFFLIVI
jgi:hypothetical protein